jgi:hypothetical protein
MQGLTGCTAIFVVVSATKTAHGLVVSDLITIFTRHLGWPSVEGQTRVNGGGSFNHRSSDDIQTPCPLKEFETVAVEIFDKATPARQKAKRPLWKSLVDVKNDYDDPFNDVRDVQIFLLTKAMSYVCSY